MSTQNEPQQAVASVTVEQLYEQANRLGEILELSFWIQASGSGANRDHRICGEVLVSEEEVVVCPEPWGTEHIHDRDPQREVSDGASR